MKSRNDLVSVNDVITLLNELVELDRPAMGSLLANRVPCNESLSNHATVQCGAQHDGFHVGLLGILNGIFGTLPNQCGKITAVFEDSDNPVEFGRRLVGFERTIEED